jgi:hypothetical protein
VVVLVLVVRMPDSVLPIYPLWNVIDALNAKNIFGGFTAPLISICPGLGF